MTHRIAGLLLDLDGTVYEDGSAIPGVDAAIRMLREAGVPIRFVTNTTRVPRSTLVQWLDGVGVPARPEDVFTPLVTAATWLGKHDVSRATLFVPDGSKPELGGVEDVSEAPDAVVIGDLGPQWTFDLMNRAFRAVLDGAAFVALHRNRYWKAAEGLALDAGAFVAAIEYATGREATVVGKPSRAMFEAAADSMGLALRDLVMVGDDLEADIGGSQALGIRGILVRTGKGRTLDPENSDIEPSMILDSLADLPDRLLG